VVHRLTLTALPGIPLVEPGDDLASLTRQALERAGLVLEAGDVIVAAQKVVSKSEGRLVDLTTVTPSARALEIAKQAEKDPRVIEVILGETAQVVRVRPGVVIVEHRLGFVCANAGVDHSNVRGPGSRSGEWVLLLPEDPDRSAAELRRRLRETTGLESLGVLINDSHGRAWRNGTVGIALGAAGFPALMDLRGRPDLFERALQVTQVGLADEIAAAASALMGQADEGRPIVHVRGVPYPLREGSAAELLREKSLDLFR
jgi:coenzyme F420-0:L-glutamate ligase/coenzyme F420-1:gamma-L-glutamate ligase